jgi:recombination protein RecA
MDVRRVGAIKDGEEITGNRTAVKIVKNKMAPPFTKTEFDLMYNEGISAEGDVLDLAVTANLVEKSGAWFSYKGERMGQGRDQAKQFLKQNPQIMETLRAQLLSSHGIGKLLLTAEGSEPMTEAEETELAEASKAAQKKNDKNDKDKKKPTASKH